MTVGQISLSDMIRFPKNLLLRIAIVIGIAAVMAMTAVAILNLDGPRKWRTERASKRFIEALRAQGDPCRDDLVPAIQALQDAGHLGAGQRVLVIGASGGVGSYAVQLAKALGAEVTGVCSTRNVEMVRALGADHVVDYTRENFTEGAGRYDVIIDNVGTYGVRDYRRVMTRDGVLVVVGSVDDGDYLGPLATMLSAMAAGMFGSQRVEPFLSSANARDLGVLRDMMQRGQLRSAIDRTYPFAEAREAIAYLETGRARGKVVVELVK